MAEQSDDVGRFGSFMSLSLPLLVFHHRHPTNDQQEDNKASDEQDQQEDNEANDDQDQQEDNEEVYDMLMYSISKQSLHTDMKRGLLVAAAGGNDSGSRMCWPTPQGWMLHLALQDDADEDTAWLWNPLTGDKLPLPDIAEEHQIPFHCSCLLSHKDPAHPGCVAVLFSRATPELWYCHTATGGNSSSNRWRHCTYDIGNRAFVPKPPKGKKARRRRRPIKSVVAEMASFQGKIYFCKPQRDMCAIDFSSCTSSSTADHNVRPTFQKLNFRMVDLPEGLCAGIGRPWSCGSQWMVESQDQLFVVSIGFIDLNPNNVAIEVHRMDVPSSTQDRWCKVNDIGDAVFLLDKTELATSCPASALGLKPNQIFFMKNFMDDDGDLCIFDLETNSQEITRVHNHEDSLVLCREPFWIVPPSYLAL